MQIEILVFMCVIGSTEIKWLCQKQLLLPRIFFKLNILFIFHPILNQPSSLSSDGNREEKEVEKQRAKQINK